MNRLYLFFKRCFDLFLSLLTLTMLSPFFLVAAVAIKLSSPGPVFYRTERIGRGRKPFVLYKFRSMHVYHPEVGSEKKTEGGYIANGSRIFPFGAFLRKSKLDELPQFLNILLGQMSVIGPRPITPAGVAKHYVGAYANVTSVRPGLACLDSLFDYAHGELFVKNEEQYVREVVPVRNCLASMYVEKRTIGLDLYCIYRTILLMIEVVVLKKKNFSYTHYEQEARNLVFNIQK